MADFVEIDFLAVETAKSGDAISVRYSIAGTTTVHVVDGGFLETGEKLVEHIKTQYLTTHIDHVVLTHTDQDHVNGLRKVLEQCTVGCLWMNRPWIYADEIIDRFETYKSVDALRKRLRTVYQAAANLEELAIEKNIPIGTPLQGTRIGTFTVMAPSRARYLDLIVESEKTPVAVVVAYDKTSMSIPILNVAAPYICITGLLGLYLYSYQKQTAYVKQRVEANKQSPKAE